MDCKQYINEENIKVMKLAVRTKDKKEDVNTVEYNPKDTFKYFGNLFVIHRKKLDEEGQKKYKEKYISLGGKVQWYVSEFKTGTKITLTGFPSKKKAKESAIRRLEQYGKEKLNSAIKQMKIIN